MGDFEPFFCKKAIVFVSLAFVFGHYAGSILHKKIFCHMFWKKWPMKTNGTHLRIDNLSIGQIHGHNNNKKSSHPKTQFFLLLFVNDNY